MKKRQKIHKVALNHNDKLRYSIGVNIVLMIALPFFVSIALNTGAMFWYALSLVSLYYLVAVGLPNLYRLTHQHVHKPVVNANVKKATAKRRKK
jgi:hypothetical protein